MILEDEGRVICRYDENKVFQNVDGVVIGMQEYRANRREIHDRDIHYSLSTNLVERIFRAHIQPNADYWYADLFDESDEDSDMFV